MSARAGKAAQYTCSRPKHCLYTSNFLGVFYQPYHMPVKLLPPKLRQTASANGLVLT